MLKIAQRSSYSQKLIIWMEINGKKLSVQKRKEKKRKSKNRNQEMTSQVNQCALFSIMGL